MLRTIIEKIRTNSIAITAHNCYRVLRRKDYGFARASRFCNRCLRMKKGLEIGGPSTFFRLANLLPIYTVADRIDNCNFASRTIWEGAIQEGWTFPFNPKRPHGYQYIREASDLKGIESDCYDFVISSHTIEHLANPIKALQEWKRVLKDDGLIILIAPHRDGTFDHHRPTTSLDHLIGDYQRDISEDDLSHLPEILQLHDLSLDPPAGSLEEFKARSLKNLENRCLHHHVFTSDLVLDLLRYVNIEILLLAFVEPCNIIAVGRKCQASTPHSLRLGDSTNDFPYSSPFKSDRGYRLKANESLPVRS